MFEQSRRVKEPFRLDHRLGLLAGGGIVKIDERLAVDGRRQERKVFADFFDGKAARAFAGRPVE